MRSTLILLPMSLFTIGTVCISAQSIPNNATLKVRGDESGSGLYGPSGKPEKEDFDVFTSDNGASELVVLYALLSHAPNGLLESKINEYTFKPKESSNLPETKSFVTITHYDRQFQRHDIIAPSPQKGRPWWLWAYLQTIWEGDSLNGMIPDFRTEEDMINASGLMRQLTGKEDVAYDVSRIKKDVFYEMIKDAATTPICGVTKDNPKHNELPYYTWVYIESVDQAKKMYVLHLPDSQGTAISAYWTALNGYKEDLS